MEPHEKVDMIQIRLSKKLLVLGIIVSVVIGGGVAVWHTITGSPHYSLFRLKQAIERKDELAVERYLDRESIATDAVSYLWSKFEAQLAEKAFQGSSTSNGWEAIGTAIGMQMLRAMEPSIKSLAVSNMTKSIDETVLGSSSSPSQGELDAALTSIKLVEVRQSGDTATTVLNNPKAQVSRLEFVMVRNPDRTWKITKISHKTLDSLISMQDVLSKSATQKLGKDLLLDQPTPSPEPAATPEIAPSPESVSEFRFPQDSCGDKTAESTDLWYPVFIDEGDLDYIRSQYCGDATSANREKTGTPTVQLASFTDYERALRFAQAVGGEVGDGYRSSSTSVYP